LPSTGTSSSPAATTASSRRASVCTVISGAGTRERAGCCGRSTRSRVPASRALRRGKATAGRIDRGRTRGRSSRSTCSAASCTPRSGRRPPTTTEAIVTATDFNPLTPDHLAYCKDLWEKNGMFTNGPYTPASTEATMVTFPSTLGGGNWNGTSYDASLGLVFTNVMNLGQVAKMVPSTDPSGRTSWARRSPWGSPVGRFWNPETKIPCSAPPFGELVAVNVNSGDIAWHVPLGFIP